MRIIMRTQGQGCAPSFRVLSEGRVESWVEISLLRGADDVVC